ncbi:MAG: sugar phosphate isomerase/epimerase [Clostridia bacterium]|nr:sugar phosphate isomerase/epimerase [Clostridia bacterium]
MWKRKLCMNLIGWKDRTPEEILNTYADTGFDGFFTDWDNIEQLKKWKKLADERGLLYKNIHAPFGRIRCLWENTADAESVLAEQIACLRDCAALGIETMVAHVFIGFRYTVKPNEAGLAYFEKIAAEAQKLGVKVAFENTEGEEFLAEVLKLADSYSSVGFCLDTGHEMCYNHSKDLLASYGHLLAETHLNDNLGIRDFTGEHITPADDLHLLPFDGIADWENIASRLARLGYANPLSFELTTDAYYAGLPMEGYVHQCYRRACRVAAMTERALAKKAAIL